MKLLLPVLLSVLLITPPVQAAPRDSDEQITHVLNRLTFGPRPGDIEKVRSIGVKRFIDAQLNPTTLAESPIVLEQLKRTKGLNAPASELLAEFYQFIKERKLQKGVTGKGKNNSVVASAASGGGPATVGAQNGDMQDPEMQNSEMQTDQTEESPRGKKAGKKVPNGGFNPRQGYGEEVIETRLVREIESPRQLNELMADFWFNHFNICMTKGSDRVLVGAYEEQAIRPYVMGNFRDLLGATMHHPAMMFYLDNAQNTKADFQSKNPKNTKRGINENYARELLELHTLGVDGGYTQKDVMELARVLTGWGMPNPRVAAISGKPRYWSTFEPQRHDMGDKVVLGHTIKGSGPKEIEQVLDILAKNPTTAKHISFQLAQYFVDDKPPQSLIDKMSTQFMKSDGNIKSVLETLFASPEFWDTKYQNSKFKSPLHYAVSAMRATGAKIDQPKQLALFLKLQGQPLYECLTPDGYKNTKEAWLNPDGLLKRMDFAVKLDNQQRRIAPLNYDIVRSTVNGGKLSEKTQEAIAKAPPYQKVAALIGSPEFMRY
jgi:uncharacterized protein (DUF1800 family)